jgi:hypothetical protein
MGFLTQVQLFLCDGSVVGSMAWHAGTERLWSNPAGCVDDAAMLINRRGPATVGLFRPLHSDRSLAALGRCRRALPISTMVLNDVSVQRGRPPGAGSHESTPRCISASLHRNSTNREKIIASRPPRSLTVGSSSPSRHWTNFLMGYPMNTKLMAMTGRHRCDQTILPIHAETPSDRLHRRP